MSFDLQAHLGTVTRAVRDLEHQGRPAKAVLASRVYDTDIHDLWDALTNPERIPRWFMPVSGTLELGGHYQLEGNASGTITGCEPPAHLALTWENRGDVSWVTVRLSATEHGTRLDLEHLAHVPEEFWSQFGPGAVGVGWDLGLLGLARHVLDPTADVAAEGAGEWATSPEALAFYAALAEAWGEAAIAGGSPEAEAKAAAERTRAFYSGE